LGRSTEIIGKGLKLVPGGFHADEQIAEAAVARMFGGQDYVGNWHYTAFNKPLLQHKLEKNGFDKVEFEELNENGETYYQNWNIKAVAEKKDLW
jgi:hypothetical protein